MIGMPVRGAVDRSLLDRARAVPGLTPSLACRKLATLATTVPPGEAIVELGVFRGRSLCALGVGALAGGATVYGVDVFDTDPSVEGRHVVSSSYAAAALDELGLSEVVQLVAGRSADVGRTWTGSPVGLLFIDGDHRYRGVQADLAAWVPHLALGAVVALDDCDRAHPGIVRAVNGWISKRALVYEGRLAHRLVITRFRGLR